VLAYLLGWPLAVGALIFGILTAVGIGALTQQGQVREDTAIGIIFAGSFALGVAMLSTVGGYAVDLAHILFGDVLAVSVRDLWIMLALSVGILLVVILFYKELLVMTFDPMLAKVLRLPTTFFRYLLLVLIALTIVTALQTVGIALVLAMLVTPAATAQLLTRRMHTMMFVAAICGMSANLIGLYLSYYVNIASGPAMVLTATLFFAIAFLFAPQRGLVMQKWRTLPTKA
jgi:ABC-type Mn2+/Zn2+ transport system permease subunit